MSQLDRQTVKPFLWVACFWWVLTNTIAALVSSGHVGAALAWSTGLWALCLFDLYALSRAMAAALGVADATGEKRGAAIIQAFYWGLIKLTCLGILGTVLAFGRAIPVASLLMGFGTLIVVPLTGGYWWSQRVLRHA